MAHRIRDVIQRCTRCREPFANELDYCRCATCDRPYCLACCVAVAVLRRHVCVACYRKNYIGTKGVEVNAEDHQKANPAPDPAA